MYNKSLKQRILELPLEEQSQWRAFYSEEEWNDSWELHALPFQLPPLGDWDSWTIIGGKGVGKTYAGVQWAVDSLLKWRNVLVIVRSYEQMMRIASELWDLLSKKSPYGYEAKSNDILSEVIIGNSSSNRWLYIILERDLPHRHFYSSSLFRVWADEPKDASVVRDTLPRAEKFLFTQPTKLDPKTKVSRAGDARAI